MEDLGTYQLESIPLVSQKKERKKTDKEHCGGNSALNPEATHFKAKECCCYVPSSSSRDACGCGRTRRDHTAGTQATTAQQWSSLEHTKTIPTNAYGLIYTRSSSWEHTLPKPFLRLSNDTSPSDVIEGSGKKTLISLLLEQLDGAEKAVEPWNHLNDRRLLLSLLEGNKHEPLKDDVKSSLFGGLERIICNVPDLLVTTDGSGTGVSKYVGEIFNKKYSRLWFKTSNPVSCAILPWGCVLDKFSEGHPGGINNMHENELQKRSDDLDPYVDIYLLIDDGTVNKQDAEKEFRNKFEKALIEYQLERLGKTKGARFGVTVLIGGGKSYIELVYNACCQEPCMSVIVVKGSGGVANMFAKIIEHYELDKAKSDLDNFVREALRCLLGAHIPDEENTVLKIKECVKGSFTFVFDPIKDPDGFHKVFINACYPRLIQIREGIIEEIIWQINYEGQMMGCSGPDTHDADSVAVQAAVAEQFTILFQAAVSLEETDLAVSLGNKLSNLATEICLQYMLKKAVKDSDFDMVKYCVVDHGMSLNRFVYLELHNLYENPNNQLKNICDVVKLERNVVYGDWRNSLDGDRLMQKLLGDRTNPKVLSHIQNLMVYAIKVDNKEIVRGLWELDKTNPLFNSVVARELLKSIVEVGALNSTELAHKKQEAIDAMVFYEESALRLLSYYQKVSKSMACDLLQKPRAFWNSKNIISVCGDRNFRGFITHSLTEEAIESEWNNPKYDGSRAMKFFVSPKRKLVVHVVMYLIFLGLFNYSILVASPAAPTALKWIIFSFVLCMVIDETKQVFHGGSTLFSFRIWASDPLNITDAIAIILYYIGFVVTFISEHEAKTIFAINILFWYWKLLHFLKMFNALGPYIIMIFKMMGQLTTFFAILFIFVPAHGVFMYVLLFPNSEAKWGILFDVLLRPFVLVFGEIGISSQELSTTQTVFGTSRISRSSEIIAIIGTCLFLLFANALMLNILIAAFSNVYDSVKEISDEIWKFERYKVIEEFKHKPCLPMPLSIVEEICYLVRLCKHRYYKVHVDKTDNKDSGFHDLQQTYEREFERVCFEKMLQDIKRSDAV